MEDIILQCIQCDSEFVFTTGEQLKFDRMGFDEPRRCPQCRQHKLKREDGRDGKKDKTKKKHYRMKYDID